MLRIDLFLHTFGNLVTRFSQEKTQNMLYVNSEKVPINCNVSDFDIEQSAIDLDLDSGMYFPDPSNFVAVMYIEVLYFGRRLLTEKTKRP